MSRQAVRTVPSDQTSDVVVQCSPLWHCGAALRQHHGFTVDCSSDDHADRIDSKVPTKHHAVDAPSEAKINKDDIIGRGQHEVFCPERHEAITVVG